MTNDIVALIEYYEKEKGIDRDKVVAALEFAFISAYRKMVPGADAIETLRADVNTRKGETRIFASLTVVADEDYRDKFNQVPLSTALKKNPAAQPGDIQEFNVTPKDFGRIAVQTAKQTMMQRLRQAEKEMIYEEFKDRAGDVVSGTVRRFERNDVMIDLGKFEGVMPNKERVQGEDYNIGDRIRCYVLAVENEGRGPEIILSRSHPNFVRRLFEAEVNEISDRTVEIRGIAREAGFRTKVAVWSIDPKVDPVGACVGMRGARVKNIVRELNNEKVDIIRWSEDPREFVREALKPAELRSITVDEANKVVHVTVDEADLSKAIGRKGQNARLSSRLMGWDVQVRRDESKEEQFKEKIGGAAHTLGEQLGISDELAEKLTLAGGIAPEYIIGMSEEDISEALEISIEEAAPILARAQEIVSGSQTAVPNE
ncbi:MAG: transcription termination factor NusA [Akkermansiaceae bacterium]|jgi:N utilization substance protein A|nr:transcription termination factor NusA [Akkermansiaceae bacterium]MCU0776971.1 transcription termination factor NusA [Akkermansiaceae bacterium]